MKTTTSYYLGLLLVLLTLKAFSQSPGCPQITSTTTGSNAAICRGLCANLTATAIANNRTTSYSVSSVAYSPFPYTGGTAVSVNTDDVWSPVVNLGFNFCFFGNTYNKVVLGSNGVLTFDLTKASTGSGYSLSTALPSTANVPIPANSIAALCRDINPASGGTIKYYVTGTAPCRALVFYFSNVPDFDCTMDHTFQLVLYENTNFIDVYIEDSQTCSTWNSGYGIIGIQNSGASTAVCPPGRNRTAFSASNEGWRFTPTGAPSYTVTWTGPSGVVGTGLGPIAVCPTVTTTYTMSMAISNCDGAITTYTNTQAVTVNNSPTITVNPTATLACTGTVALTTTVTPVSTYSWTGPGIVSGGTAATATVNTLGTYTVKATAAGCYSTTTISVVAPPPLTLTPTSTSYCAGGSGPISASGASTYTWSPTTGLSPSTGATVTANPTVTTTYTVNGTNGICTGSTTALVTVRPKPGAVLSYTDPSCGNNNGVIVITNTSPALPAQTISSYTSNAGTVSGQTVTALGAGSPVITLTNNYGCTYTVSTTLTNSPPITNVALTPKNISCGVGTGSITIGAVTGGTSTYSYSINGGAYSISPPVTGLSVGVYTVGVMDSKGCVYSKTVSITSTNPPTAITGTTSSTGCGAATGSYTVTGVTSGTPTYSFGVDGAAVSTSSVTGTLAAGTHTILVRDGNNCTFSTTFNISATSGPSAATVTINNATCGNANGSATVSTVTGGTTPLQYSFNGGGFTTTNNIAGLSAGSQTVIVRDANSCTIAVNFSVANSGVPTASIVSTSSVNCNGGATGSFTVSASGGAPGYGYTITPTGASNAIGIFNSLTAQTYTINIRDGAGCTFSLTNIVAQPTALTLTVTPTPITCNGANNGTIAASAANGTGPYQYSLDGGAFQPGVSFTGLTPGTHSITVRDNNNCVLTKTTSITQPIVLALTFTTSPTACVGTTGAATVGVTGGTASYSYSVDAISTSSVASGLSFGTHTVTVRDAQLCLVTNTINITMVTGPTASTVATLPATCGSANGSATVTTVTGGSTPYQYSFDGGSFGSVANIGSLTAGTHTVIIKDNNSCEFTKTYNISNTGSPSATIASSVNVNCFGGSTGSFTVNTSGGSPNYSYTLSPGATTNTTGVFASLTAQPYNVTVKDAIGCVTTVSVLITEPTALTSVLTTTNITCNGANNGTISVSASDGTSSYQYSLDGGGFQPGTSFTGITSGTHSVTVRDNNNCTLTKTVSITQPAVLALTFTTIPNSCAGAIGSVTIGVTGGTTAYSYSIDGTSASNTFSGLSSGTHTATIVDAMNCVVNGTFSIGNITAPSSASIITTNATCGTANGSATVTSVTGGLAPYQYSFNGGAISTTSVVGTLMPGGHTAIVVDANTCTLSVPFTVLNNSSPTASVTGSTPVTCNGLSNGSFTVVGSGGSGGPFTYSLTTSPFTNNGNLTVFGPLPAGTYNINVKDVAGCLVTASVVINQPTVLTLTPTAIDAKCNGTATGTVNVAGLGGTGTYSYNIDGFPYQASSSFTAVASGVHNIQIRDINNCTATQTIQVNQPTALTQTMTTQNANCTAANGTATTSVSGGTSPYFYSWTSGAGASPVTNSVVSGSYSVTITDSKSCTLTAVANIGNTPGGTAAITGSSSITCFNAANGSLTAGMVGGTPNFSYSWTPSGGTNATSLPLGPGTYTCTITDNFGCVSSAQASLSQPTALTAIMNSNNVKCFGTPTGTVSASGSGGAGGYTYLWPTIPSTLSTVPGVPQGNYDCIIKDANGCQITQSVVVNQPTAISLTSATTAATCNQTNGSATVTPSGGVGGYTYNWGAGATPLTAVLKPVVAGTYTVEVKDANNCTQILSATIPNLAGPTIGIATQTNVNCFGENNGIATTTVSGGTGTYTFLWNPSNQFTQNATGLLAGVHTVSVTDQAGCVASTSVNITQPTALTMSIVPTNPKCAGSSDGFGVGMASGGSFPYTYTWSPSGGNASTSSPLPQGIYTGVAKDAHGCIASATMALVSPPAMQVSITSTNVTCFNACNGVAVGSASNNIGAVNYGWTGVGISPISTQTLSGLCAGTYSLLATDLNGCTATNQIVINQPSQVTASISATGSITCNGGSDGFATVSSLGGTGTHTYSWTPTGGTNATAPNLSAGSYVVTVKDQNNCVATASATIVQPNPLVTNLTQANPKCFGVCDGTANIAYSGGSGSTTFLWLPGLQSGNSVNTLCAGSQTVVITSNGTCTTSLTFSLTSPAQLTAVLSATASHCQQSDGAVCAVVSGGSVPYQSTTWSNAATTLCSINVPANSYTFTVIDNNSCQFTNIIPVNDIAGPNVVVTGTTAVKCFGESNGTANATITGGTGTLNIVWSGTSPVVTTPTVATLNQGLHTITVTDQAGCISSGVVNITQPAQILSAIGSQTNVSCNGLTDGGATLLATGGTTLYAYSWSPSGQINDILVNVGAGVHTCTITDANMCTKTQTVTITQPAPVTINGSTITPVLCNGGNTGQIATSVTGGSSIFTYVWTPTQPNSPNLNAVSFGSYSLSVTDTRGCATSTVLFVNEPPVISSSVTSLPSTCGLSNGSATVAVGGGSPFTSGSPYNLSWNAAPFQTGPIAINLPTNNYTCTIIDKNGCTSQQTVNIGSAPSPTITSITHNNPTCFGYQNGDVQVNYISGTPNYQVAWSSPISQTLTTSATTNSVPNVGAGLYFATVTDANGCSHTSSVSVTQPTVLVLSPIGATKTSICYGQPTQLSVTSSGGTSPYSYTWTPSTGTGNGTAYTLNPLTTTIYNVHMTDVHNCPALDQQITIVVSPSLQIAGTTTTVCEGDQALLIPSFVGGNVGNGGLYTFTWNDGTIHTNTLTTSNTKTGAIPSPQNYTVTVNDGCTTPNASAVFTVNVNPLPVVTFSADLREGCAPLTIRLTGTSDGVNDMFTWGIPKNSGAFNNSTTYATLNDSGKYTITLTVLNPATQCRNTEIKTDYIYVYPKPEASFLATPMATSILDPNINFINTSIGATSYVWDFGDPAALNGTNNSYTVNPSHTYAYVGEYDVHLVATSNKGCRDTAHVRVEITPDFALYIPNTFTPDGNGLNDFFQPQGVGIDEDNYHMDVFDRWGENIYSGNNFRKGWDGSVKGGKQAEQGVYVYKLLVYDMQGNKHPFIGHVTVIRTN